MKTSEFTDTKLPVYRKQTSSLPALNSDKAIQKQKYNIAFTLNRQYRTWPLTYGWQGDTLIVTCKEATYRIPRSIVEHGANFCWDIPADGAEYESKGTFAFISRKALRELQEKGSFVYDGITWRLVRVNPSSSVAEKDNVAHVRADIDQTEMWIKQDDHLPLVLEIRNNPLGIDWNIE